MTQANPAYFDLLDAAALRRDYPLGEAFLTRHRTLSPGQLRQQQEQRFLTILAFAWRVPFYQRLWGKAGLEPGDVRGLDDIDKLPTYSKADLMASVEAYPPLGDFHGLDSYPPERRPPLIFQTTSGTTGRPQPLLYGPHSREVQNLLLARLYALQGLRRDDVIHSVYGHGMVNGGHYVREAIQHWLGCQLLSAGSGAETRSLNQVQLMHAFRVSAVVGFGDYIRRLAAVAREAGLTPGEDIPVRLISGHLGADSRAALSEAWGGAAVYDWYGVGDTGCIAGEGPDQDGMYVMEDAQYVELLDIDDDRPVVPGDEGNIVCTCLFKNDVFPIVRFNTHDVSRELGGRSSLGLRLRRLAGFLGRSDNMVKLRGVNIYPTGIGTLLVEHFAQLTGEYLCRLSRRDGRDELTVLTEVDADLNDAELRSALEGLLRTRLGVEIDVELAARDQLAPLTGIESRQKPLRLIDER